MERFEIRFHKVLVELINAERSSLAQHLVDGKAADWADYRWRVGVLEGLKMARELSDQIATDTVGREKDLETMMEDR